MRGVWGRGGGVEQLLIIIIFPIIRRAVKFTSKLFGRALSRRIKATILFATETGRSEQYAKQLGELLNHAFNAQVRVPISGVVIH